ncbi:cupin domain-containing protein [Kitasatospora sp. NPDC058965]|uniref:cupin domain-containing protein n=1 Tax=Kitasatospora sp. NPDC058965 TaxID=3346682 RepID=UPI00368DBB24
MTFPRDAGELTAVFRPSAGNDSVTFPNGTVPRFVAPGSATGERFGLFEWHMAGPRGERDSGHFHKTFSESFYILSGEVTLFDGREWVTARQGDFLFVPEGGVHGFTNESDAPASMLVLFTPGPAREKFFQELAEIRHSGRELDEEEWAELYARHDQYRA